MRVLRDFTSNTAAVAGKSCVEMTRRSDWCVAEANNNPDHRHPSFGTVAAKRQGLGCKKGSSFSSHRATNYRVVIHGERRGEGQGRPNFDGLVVIHSLQRDRGSPASPYILAIRHQEVMDNKQNVHIFE